MRFWNYKSNSIYEIYSILFDSDFPDGTLKKNLDSKIIKSFGWTPKTKISVGLNRVYSSIKD